MEEQLRQEVKALMNERNISAYKLANDAGIAQSTLREWFAKRRSMRVETLGFVLEALGLTLCIRPPDQATPTAP